MPEDGEQCCECCPLDMVMVVMTHSSSAALHRNASTSHCEWGRACVAPALPEEHLAVCLAGKR